jgi:hypothetical protein
MVPLYAARIEDLGPGDFVRVECIACGRDELIPHSSLLHGLRLPPYTPVLVSNRGSVAGNAMRVARRSCRLGGRPAEAPQWIEILARGTFPAPSCSARRSVLNLRMKDEVIARVRVRRSGAALGGAVLRTDRCRQWAGRCRCGRRSRCDCRRWPGRRYGSIGRRYGRRRDWRVQPAPELRLPVPRLPVDPGPP